MSQFTIKTVESEVEYQALSKNDNNFLPFTQSFTYGEWQKSAGRKVWRFLIKKNGQETGFFQIIKYPLMFGKSYLYIPHGPIFYDDIEENFLKVFSDCLKKIGSEEKAVFVRFDPMPEVKNQKIFYKHFSRPKTYSLSGSYFQPKIEWVLDLRKEEKDLLADMMKDGRYSINLAERKGTKAKMIIGEEINKYFEIFCALMEETAKRDGFRLHPESYYRNIFNYASLNKDDIALFLAENSGKILSAHLVTFFGKTAFDLYGGSGSEARELMPNYALQWKAIKESKKRGCIWYDFGAVDSNQNSNGKFAGITLFKQKFGGKLFEYGSSFDLVISQFWYNLYNFRKLIRRRV